MITNVTGTDDVESILIGQNGAIHSASPGTLFVDHSTIDPARTMHIASTLREAGMDFVDAPVSGGVWASEEGRLIVMQGGHPDACERANQVIECYAKMITRVGDAGHGQIAKLSNQIAQTITIQGVAECLTFAKNLGPKMITEDFDAGIEARLHAKDVGIAIETAKAHQLPLPCLEFVASQYRTIMDQNLGTRDSSILFDLLRRLKEC